MNDKIQNAHFDNKEQWLSYNNRVHESPAILTRLLPFPAQDQSWKIAQRAQICFGNMLDRLPFIRKIAWQLVSPCILMISEYTTENHPEQSSSETALTSNFSTYNPLLRQLKGLTFSIDKIELINDSVIKLKSGCLPEDRLFFDEAVDWLNRHLLVKDRGSTVITMRSIEAHRADLYALEDAIRMLSHGVSFEVLAQRHKITPTPIPSAMKELLTPEVWAALIEGYRIQKHDDTKIIFKRVNQLILSLSAQISTADQINNKAPGLMALNVMIYNMRHHDSSHLDVTETKQHYQIVNQLRLNFANLLWSVNYNSTIKAPHHSSNSFTISKKQASQPPSPNSVLYAL